MSVKDAFLGELYDVLRLEVLSSEIGGEPLMREYLVRRAAAFDRLADADWRSEYDADALLDALHYARALVEYDTLLGTTLGDIPVSAPCWAEDPRGYARQEHAMWVLKHDVPEAGH
ncbi:hypothetical protein [Streptomyces mobaraensis]|uniref:Uncharacterized protein n=1 Tax=Streptomyces mobaraensis TaxID=35621 RepID=A0A5N5WEF8_STRMB|nr:hypothetical protein [Streptomyces mobaraensis]KAB7850125.1 hypothetical protein FRZ00_05860 [Streptomyces mobaraensis]